MADLNYWRLVETTEEEKEFTGPVLEVTMLATGDVLADIQAMTSQAKGLDMKNPIITLWQSTGHGEEKHEDGKDKYRAHTLVMSVEIGDTNLLAEYP